MRNKMKSKTISRFSNSDDSTSENGKSVAINVVPRYRFHDADGEHLHTLDGKPLYGTSTIAGATSSKDGLLWWSAERAAVACLESGEHIPTIRKEYEEVCALGGKDRKNARDRLQRKYPIFKKARYAHKEAKEAAAQPGTDMHGELEDYIKKCIYDHAGRPIDLLWDNPEVARFDAWARDNVQEFLWSEAHCYSEQLWTGGICDVGMILKKATPFGRIAIGDFKSGKDAYFSQFVQVGGYARQIRENGLFTAEGTPIMTLAADPVGALIIFYFGCDGEPRIETNVPAYMNVFEGSVWHYELKQKFEQ